MEGIEHANAEPEGFTLPYNACGSTDMLSPLHIWLCCRHRERVSLLIIEMLMAFTVALPSEFRELSVQTKPPLKHISFEEELSGVLLRYNTMSLEPYEDECLQSCPRTVLKVMVQLICSQFGPTAAREKPLERCLPCFSSSSLNDPRWSQRHDLSHVYIYISVGRFS